MKLEEILPADWASGSFLGRMDFDAGPTPVLLTNGTIESLYHLSLTVSGLLETFPDNLDFPSGDVIAHAIGIEINQRVRRNDSPSQPVARVLSPVDLQCIKAAGVTFAVSTLERVIEEKAKGDPRAALSLRIRLNEKIGADIRKVQPGSRGAEILKRLLIQEGLWSKYLEVAIGPDAEIFTKGAPLSSVGAGDFIGIRQIAHGTILNLNWS